MNYLIIVALGFSSFYILTFAKYSWAKKNKRAAAGLILLAIVSFVYPVVMLILRW